MNVLFNKGMELRLGCKCSVFQERRVFINHPHAQISLRGNNIFKEKKGPVFGSKGVDALKVYDGSIIYYRDEGPGKLGFFALRIAESDNILMLIKLADNNPVWAVIFLAGLLNPALYQPFINV